MAVDINITKSKEEKIKDVLKSHFESDIRSDIGLCSYLIFPDGTLISGYAHRDMLDYLVDAGVIGASHSSDNDDEYGQWDTDIFNEVFSCIRCTDIDNDENYIGLPDTPLTEAQYKVLEKWIDNNINLGRPVLQVTTRYHWDDQHNVFYNYKEIMEYTWPTEYIIKKIKKYYNTGKLEEELDIIPDRETQLYSYHSDDILLNVVVPGTEWAGKAYSRISFSFEKELSKKVSEKLFNDGYTGVQDFKAHECTLSKYSRVIWSSKSLNLRVEFPANDSIENFFRPLLTEEDFKAVFDSEAYYLIKNDLEPLDEKIVKKGSKWQVQSEKGRNLGTYDTKPEAEKRLQQVHYFKHKNEDLELDMVEPEFPKSAPEMEGSVLLTPEQYLKIKEFFDSVGNNSLYKSWFNNFVLKYESDILSGNKYLVASPNNRNYARDALSICVVTISRGTYKRVPNASTCIPVKLYKELISTNEEFDVVKTDITKVRKPTRSGGWFGVEKGYNPKYGNYSFYLLGDSLINAVFAEVSSMKINYRDYYPLQRWYDLYQKKPDAFHWYIVKSDSGYYLNVLDDENDWMYPDKMLKLKSSFVKPILNELEEDLDLEILPDVSAVPSVRQAPYGFTRYEIIDPEYKEEIISEIPNELSVAKEKYRNHLNDDWYLFVWNGSKNQGYINVFKDGKRIIGMPNDGFRPSMPIVQEIVANAASINESVGGLQKEEFDIIDNKKIDKEEIHALFGGKLIGERWILDDSRKDILYNLLNTPDHNMTDLDRLYHDENIAWTVAKYYNTESNFAPDCYLQFKNLSTGLSVVSGWGMFGLPISEEQFDTVIKDTGLEEDLEIMPGPDDSWKEYHDRIDTYFGLPISDAERLILNRWEEFSWYLAVYNPESGVWVDGLYGDLEDNINGVMSFPEAFEKFKALELRPGERVVLCYHQGAEYDENDELDFGEENYPILTKGEVTPENELYEDLDILEAPEYNKEYLTYHINYKPENIIKNYWPQNSWYLMTTDEQYYTLSGALKELHDYNGLGTFKEMYDAFLNYDFAGDETSVYLMWYDVDDEFSEEFEILKRDRYTFEEELDVMSNDSVFKSLLTSLNDNDIIEKLEESYNIYVNEEGKAGYVKKEDEPRFGSDLEDEAFDYIERHWIQLIPSSDSLYSNLNHIFIEMPMNKLTPGQVQWLKKNSDWLQDCPDYKVSINDAVDDVTEFLDVHGYLTEEFEVINGFPPGHLYSDNGQNYYVLSKEAAAEFLPEFITHLKSWNHSHDDIEFLENILETHELGEYDIELIRDDQKVYVIIWDMDGNSLEIGTGLDTWYRKWNNVVHFKEIPTWNYLEEELDVIEDPHPEIVEDKKSKTTYTLPLVCCQRLLDALIELLGYSRKQRTLIELRKNLEEQPEQPIKLIVWHHFNIFMLEYDLNVNGVAYELVEVEDENDLRNINGEICKVIDDMFGWNYLETFLKEIRVEEELDLDVIEIPDYRHNYDVHINYGGPQNPDEVIAEHYGEEVWTLDVESQATGNIIGRGWEGDLAEGFNGWFTFDEGYKKLLEYTNNYRFYKSISVHLCCKYTLSNNYQGIYSILFRYIDGKDIVEQLKELKEDFEEISAPSERYEGDIYLNGLYKVGNDNILEIIEYVKDHPESMKLDGSTSVGTFEIWKKYGGNLPEVLEDQFNADVIWMYFSKDMDRDREDANMVRRFYGKLLLADTSRKDSMSFDIDDAIVDLIKKNAVTIKLKQPVEEELEVIDSSGFDKSIRTTLIKFLLDMGEYVCDIGDVVFEGNPSCIRNSEGQYEPCRDAAFKVEGGQVTVYYPEEMFDEHGVYNNQAEVDEWYRIETAKANHETDSEQFLKHFKTGRVKSYEDVFYDLGELWGLSKVEMDEDYLSLIK